MADIHEIVDVVFTKLSLVYGRDFMGRWEGLDLQDVKNDWAHELSGFENAPHAIKYALQNLPVSKPPNVFEFRAIAYKAPAQRQAALLEAPVGDPKKAEEAKQKAREMLAKFKGKFRNSTQQQHN